MRISEIMAAPNDLMSSVEQAANQLFRGFGEESQFTEATVQREQAILKRLMSGGAAHLFRVMFLTPEALAGLQAGGRLSREIDDHLNSGPKMPFSSWTTSYKTINLDALNVSGWDHDGEKFFLIKAMIPANAIDVPSSIAQRLELPWEEEVCVIKNRSIRMMGMWELDEHPIRAVKVVRPDLNNKIMKS